jgi:hypothetical protein
MIFHLIAEMGLAMTLSGEFERMDMGEKLSV